MNDLNNFFAKTAVMILTFPAVISFELYSLLCEENSSKFPLGILLAITLKYLGVFFSVFTLECTSKFFEVGHCGHVVSGVV